MSGSKSDFADRWTKPPTAGDSLERCPRERNRILTGDTRQRRSRVPRCVQPERGTASARIRPSYFSRTDAPGSPAEAVAGRSPGMSGWTQQVQHSLGREPRKNSLLQSCAVPRKAYSLRRKDWECELSSIPRRTTERELCLLPCKLQRAAEL